MNQWLEDFLIGLLIAAGKNASTACFQVHDEVALGVRLDGLATQLELEQILLSFVKPFPITIKAHIGDCWGWGGDPLRPRQIPRRRSRR